LQLSLPIPVPGGEQGPAPTAPYPITPQPRVPAALLRRTAVCQHPYTFTQECMSGWRSVR